MLIARFTVGLVIACCALATAAAQESAPQMRLADPLDRPGESYCIDALGVGDTARADLPLVVHNCLPERASSDRIVIEQDGRLVSQPSMPASPLSASRRLCPAHPSSCAPAAQLRVSSRPTLCNGSPAPRRGNFASLGPTFV